MFQEADCHDSYVETPLILEPGQFPDDMPKDTERQNLEADEAEIEAAIQSALEAINYFQEGRLKKFWELFVDEGNLSSRVAKSPGKDSTFSLPEWDFDDEATQENFLRLMKKICPSSLVGAALLYMVTHAGHQPKNGGSEAKAARGETKIGKGQVNFAKKVFMLAIDLGAHATIEHPDSSVMWQTSPMKALRLYYDVKVDRCRTGLVARDHEGQVLGPVRKRTRLRTTSESLAYEMDLKCTCGGPHVPMIGRSQELKAMQNYEEGFVERAARAILEDMELTWARRKAAEIMTLEDLPERVPDGQHAAEALNKDLIHKVGRSALMTVAKLHRQLGHPGRGRLVQAVRDYGLGHNVVKAAQGYKCSVCGAHTVSRLQ